MDTQSNGLEAFIALARPEPVAETTTSSPEEAQGVAHATFDDAVAVAETALQSVCRRAGNNLAAFDDVMPLVYTAITSLEEGEGCKAFLATRKLKTHGNVRNPISPILRSMANPKHKHVRAWLSKYACVIALARCEKVSPSEFLTWRKTLTLEEACKKWRDLQKAKTDVEGTQAALGTPGLRKLQSAWEGASLEDRAAFLAQNKLLRVE